MRLSPLPLAQLSLSVALACTAFTACADETTTAATASQPAETTAPAIEVKALRDPAIMPYKQAYEMLTGIQKATQDKVRVIIRVLASGTRQQIPDLQIRLESNENRWPVPVSDKGIIDVPVIAKAYAEGAEFVTNQKKGSLGADLTLVPVLPPDGFSAAQIRDSLDAGRTALREMVPWYYRIFISNPKGVAVCYDNPHQQIVLRGQQERVVAATEARKNPYGSKWFCGNFIARELENEQILPAAGYHLLYL
ncbi:hypothetical protein [Undibacterium squillarum]|uniref:Lipoprotein n=1 Tax=Undibacterium squillarum TaxID=1131567 RepID=A0ABQ2XV94_9BURK|nr:hypothetical protein [Undibacterium squillarum]GGX34241.1 hypothetical protein GCM10010946_09240 [Undibacterium squillarum]